MQSKDSNSELQESIEKTWHRILVVDDDLSLGKTLIDHLSPDGFQVEVAQNRKIGIEMALTNGYSLIIIDISRPDGENDFSVLQRILSFQNTPLFALGGRNDNGDLITGLEMGADEYLEKPLNPLELVARIRAVLRRINAEIRVGPSFQVPEKITVGDVEADVGTRTLTRAGEIVHLTSVEFSILEILLRKAGRVVSREELMEAALGRSFLAYDRTIDVHISKLRKKLGYKVSGLERIKSIHGEGYLYALSRVKE